MRRIGAGALVATLAAALLAGPATPAATAQNDQLRQVLFVGNNWDGTVDVLTADGELDRVGSLNVVPDRTQRLIEIYLNPIRLVFFLAIRQLIGEGNDQFVDDMYTSPDGQLLIVSRPSLADVAAINIRTGRLAWRFPVSGLRSDHMALSPDGRQVAVSASTGNVVHLLDVATGREVGRFPTGDSPHENTYIGGGRHIVNASIGTVYTPLDHPLLDTTKGERFFQIYDRDTNQVVKRIDMSAKLAAAGHPNMSAAVRPMTFSPDERFVYFQVSFFHGFVEYDLQLDQVTRVAELPNLVPNLPRSSYLLDSAHHGIVMNTAGTKICVAGTMSDYATIVSRTTFQNQGLVRAGQKPYWATRSADGNLCFVSWSGTDTISAISYATGQEVARADVGDHPQRMRLGFVSRNWPN
ncbi:MAG TPA: PQQ-binding-like beta-propeller repeat protein [Actinophytocola sp.]|uniref:YncE family protein n=1 Tax=Actinophytocola sp. TaxID=1872138 RepID=UPI002DBBEE36|nr:PQQ-binding-like beta-propeller repeat protein [Actinophytocola sp.]HEU5470706.1 PQQ-binding-like beta-propeller repeat protein [Actinophytocola sp.]